MEFKHLLLHKVSVKSFVLCVCALANWNPAANTCVSAEYKTHTVMVGHM